MGQVDDDAHLVQFPDHGAAEAREAAVRGLQATVAEPVPLVVRQLKDPDAESPKRTDAVELRPDELGVLQAEDDSDPPRSFGLPDILGARSLSRKSPHSRDSGRRW